MLVVPCLLVLMRFLRSGEAAPTDAYAFPLTTSDEERGEKEGQDEPSRVGSHDRHLQPLRRRLPTSGATYFPAGSSEAKYMMEKALALLRERRRSRCQHDDARRER